MDELLPIRDPRIEAFMVPKFMQLLQGVRPTGPNGEFTVFRTWASAEGGLGSFVEWGLGGLALAKGGSITLEVHHMTDRIVEGCDSQRCRWYGMRLFPRGLGIDRSSDVSDISPYNEIDGCLQEMCGPDPADLLLGGTPLDVTPLDPVNNLMGRNYAQSFDMAGHVWKDSILKQAIDGIFRGQGER